MICTPLTTSELSNVAQRLKKDRKAGEVAFVSLFVSAISINAHVMV